MLTWQGINWKERKWSKEEWGQLAQLLNSGQEFNWLGIQYPYIYHDLETDQWYEFPKDAIPDAHWYERARIQRALFHEGLFTIYFGWEAGFSEKRKVWIWIRSPNENGEPVNARDFNTLEKDEMSDRPYQPSILETSHGNLLRLGEDRIFFPEYSYRIDPLTDVRSKRSDGSIYGGLFLAPPDYGVKLFLNQIKSME